MYLSGRTAVQFQFQSGTPVGDHRMPLPRPHPPLPTPLFPRRIYFAFPSCPASLPSLPEGCCFAPLLAAPSSTSLPNCPTSLSSMLSSPTWKRYVHAFFRTIFSLSTIYVILQHVVTKIPNNDRQLSVGGFSIEVNDLPLTFCNQSIDYRVRGWSINRSTLCALFYHFWMVCWKWCVRLITLALS